MDDRKKKIKDTLRMNPFASFGLTVFVLFLVIHYWDNAAGVLVSLSSAALPLTTGCIIAYILNILLDAFERLYDRLIKGEKAQKFKRAVSIVLTLLSLILIISGIAWLIVPQLKDCVTLLINSLGGGLQQLADYMKGIPAMAKYGEWIQVNLINDLDSEAIVSNAVKILKSGAAGWSGAAMNIIQQIASTFGTFGIGLFFAIYILAGKETLARQSKRLIHTFIPKAESRLLYVLSVFDNSFRNFIVGQVKDAILLGIMTTAGMLILRIPYAPMIGVIITVFALIPIVGAILGAVIGCILVLSVSASKALIFLIWFIVIQQFDGNVTYPRIVGGSIGLPGIWVLAAVTVGGSMAGVLGMLFFIPIFSACYRLLREEVERIEHSRDVAEAVESAADALEAAAAKAAAESGEQPAQ